MGIGGPRKLQKQEKGKKTTGPQYQEPLQLENQQDKEPVFQYRRPLSFPPMRNCKQTSWILEPLQSDCDKQTRKHYDIQLVFYSTAYVKIKQVPSTLFLHKSRNT